MLTFLLVGLVTLGIGPDAVSAPGVGHYGNPPIEDAALEQWLHEVIADMTVAEKVGQMFVPYVYGTSGGDQTPDNVARNRSYAGIDNFNEMIEKYHVGGIILAGWAGNFVNASQTAALTNAIQEKALSQRVPIPLLLGADAEISAPISNGATVFASNMALGAARDPALAYKAAQTIGRELKSFGINQNYAPVADVNVNPANPVIGMRSFGSDPGLVSRLTVAQTIGFQNVGVVATAKHFPGHGDTDVDSHVGLPVIHRTVEELWDVDLPPFQAAIDAGLDAIMTAHIVVPALDPSGRPATLSKLIVTDLLRRRMGFDGVVLTDALNMQGVRAMFGDDRIAIEAILAGVDLLLFPMNMTIQHGAVMDAVARGEITEARLDESVYRIIKLKAKRGLFATPFVAQSGVDRTIGSAEHLAEAAAVTQRAVTLVKNDANLLPLTDVAGAKVLIAGTNVDRLASALAKAGLITVTMETGSNPTSPTIDKAIVLAQQTDWVVVLTNDANRQQARLVRELRQTGRPVITVAIGPPYDINVYPEVETHLVTFGATGTSMQGLAEVLLGQVNPSGRLPVMIPVAEQPERTMFPAGHGLRYTVDSEGMIE